MAKFKTNHNQNSVGGGMLTKVGLFGVIIGGLFWAFNQFMGGESPEPISEAPQIEVASGPQGPGAPPEPEVADYFLPSSTTGQVIKHAYYALSYSEAYEQAEWVAYELTRERLSPPYTKRTDNFRPDPKVSKQSASTRDYRGTGYDRGHLAPAGDMSFSEEAMSQSFYMSNISPQIRNFNSGIWRELEENVRDWARKFKHLYVVTGPILTRDIREQIGANEVAVPEEFYKVLLDLSEPEIKAIAFILPNEISYEPISEFAVSIDEVERITGIDFFPELLEEDDEAILESTFDPELWPLNSKRYERRISNWNKKQ